MSLIKSLSVGICHLNLTQCNYSSISSTFSQRIMESYFCHQDEREYLVQVSSADKPHKEKIKLSFIGSFWKARLGWEMPRGFVSVCFGFTPLLLTTPRPFYINHGEWYQMKNTRDYSKFLEVDKGPAWPTDTE